MSKKNLPDQLLDVWQVSDYLGITEPSARRLIRDGVIPVIKMGGKPKSGIRVRRSALDALLEASPALHSTVLVSG